MEKTLGKVAFEAWWGNDDVAVLWEAKDESARKVWHEIANAVIAEVERRRWKKWPDENGDGEYPPDETDVLIYCGNWASKDSVIGRISKRGGTYGPSGASHWTELPAPPEATNEPA